MNKLGCLIGMFITCGVCEGQIDLQCNGRDMHSIYITDYNFSIYRIDSLDTSPTNPILVTSNTPTYAGGISINPNFDSLAGPETVYFADYSGPDYYFWNGSGWSFTNHSCGVGSSAVNPGGTSNYIFNLDGNGNSVYRYDGTSNGKGNSNS